MDNASTDSSVEKYQGNNGRRDKELYILSND